MPPRPVTSRRRPMVATALTRSTAVNTLDERRRGPGLFVVAVWVTVMTLAQVMRQPGVPSWDSLWQEDGGVFLTDSLHQSFPRALVHSYNAYLHVVPRIVAAVAAALPLERAALVLSVGAALIVAVLSVYVYYASAALLRPQWARVLLAATFVLLPATAYETNANVANLHWYLLFACFWVFLYRPGSWPGIAVAATVAAAAVLSDPLVGLFLPLAALAVYKRTGRRDLIVPGVFVVALGIQLALGAASSSPAPYSPTHVADLPGIYALRVAGSFLIGDRPLATVWGHLRWWFAYPGLLLVAAFLLYGVITARASSRFYIVVSVAYSCCFLAVPLYLRGTEGHLDGAGFTLVGSRYTVVPIWFLVLATLLVLDRAGPPGREAAWRGLQCAFAVYLSFLVVVNFSDFAVRTDGPSWRAGLRAAREQCARGQLIDRGAPGVGGAVLARVRAYRADVLIPIAPNVDPHPFQVPITCARLRDG